MKQFNFPDRSQWAAILERPVISLEKLESKVRPVLDEIQKNGDKALSEFTLKFDGVSLGSFNVSEEEFKAAETQINSKLKSAIKTAAANIKRFHEQQKETELKIETMPGVLCWRKSVAIEKVGLYIPGGTAPLFSTVLMLGIPAKLAGCKEIVLCTPPGKDGKVHPAILYTANLIGLNSVFKIGGAQAIGAMAYGTESVPKCYKIFGPGNQYVTLAKQLINKEGIAIDMPAGPSEVAVVADETGVPSYIAADLLSQAEHGIDSQVLFISTSEELIKNTLIEIDKQLINLPRKELAKKALENSHAVLLENKKDCLEMINEYAPEHLILAINNDEEFAEKVINAGSVFLGNYSPESVGDYASGTNHTLPTNSAARAYSGVSLDSFVKKITYQKLTKEGLRNIGETVEIMAEAEELMAHKNAVSIRLKDL